MNTRKKSNGKKNKDVIKFNVSISANVIIEKEEDLYIAHCLEFDIVADGRTEKEAMNNIFESIVNHIDFCLAMGNIDKIENPAPKKYWDKLKAIKRGKVYKRIKSPKIVQSERPKLPFLNDVNFECSKVYADA